MNETRMKETRAIPMNPNECPNELDWSAFCYAAGELSPAEAEQFESRLADEQSAREALARAVELTQTVAAAESQADKFQDDRLVVPARRAVAEWSTRLSWMAMGGLASVAIALVWAGVVGHSSSGPSEKQLALANAWTQTRAEIAQAKEDGLWLPPTWMFGEADEDLLAMNDAGDESALSETPSWMTAAVFGLAGEAPIVEPFTNTRGEN
jgi:anti-sigma factor RsiW